MSVSEPQSITEPHAAEGPFLPESSMSSVLFCLVSGTSAERRQRPHPGGRRSGGAQPVVFFSFLPFCDRTSSAYMVPCIRSFSAVSDGVMQYQRAHAIAGPACAPHDPVMLRTWAACSERAIEEVRTCRLWKDARARMHSAARSQLGRSGPVRRYIDPYVPVGVKARLASACTARTKDRGRACSCSAVSRGMH